MIKIPKIVLVIFFFFFVFQGLVTAANLAVVNVSAVVNPINDLSLVRVVIPPEYSQVIPTGNYADDINSSVWNVVPPIEVVMAVTTNAANANLVIYTQHRQQSYWTGLASQLSGAIQINGLVNVDFVTDYNWYAASVPLRAWADIWNAGILPADNAKWTWILDMSGAAPGPQNTLNSGPFINNNTKIYLKSAWDKGKIKGKYQARLFLGLIFQ